MAATPAPSPRWRNPGNAWWPVPWLLALSITALGLGPLACSSSSDKGAAPIPTPTTGSLTVSIVGLPTGTPGSVAVSGPSIQQMIQFTSSFSNLSPGSYSITPGQVSGGGGLFSATSQTIQISAGQSTTATVSYSRINQAPSAPSITGPASLQVGTHGQFFLSSIDPDGDPVTFQLTSNQTGASISGNVLNWVPVNTQVGAQTLSVVAKDAAGATSIQGSLAVTVSPAPSVSVSVSPASITMAGGSSQTFTATVSGSSNLAVTWSTTGGVLSGATATTVQYQAPTAPGSYLVTATSVADSAKSAQATVTVATSGWSSAPSMSKARAYHTATLLADGRVLVAGGSDGSQNLAECQIFNPNTNSWDAAAPMPTPESDHAAIRLADGKVLVRTTISGGSEKSYLFDPASNSWSTTSAPAGAVDWDALAQLADGRILSVAPWSSPPTPPYYPVIARCEVFSPGLQTWTETGRFADGRSNGVLLSTQDGTPIYIGGNRVLAESGPRVSSASVDQYNASTGTWSSLPSCPFTAWYYRGVRLASGSLLIAGGAYDGSGVLVSSARLSFTPTPSWTVDGTMGSPRVNHCLVLLPSGKVLAAGGSSTYSGSAFGPALASAEVYSETTHAWQPVAPMGTARAFARAVRLNDGRILVIGGRQANSTQVTASCEFFLE